MDWFRSKSVRKLGPNMSCCSKQHNFRICSEEIIPPNLKKFATMPFELCRERRNYWWGGSWYILLDKRYCFHISHLLARKIPWRKWKLFSQLFWRLTQRVVYYKMRKLSYSWDKFGRKPFTRKRKSRSKMKEGDVVNSSTWKTVINTWW